MAYRDPDVAAFREIWKKRQETRGQQTVAEQRENFDREMSAIPLAITFAMAFAAPRSAAALALSGFGAHLLNLKGIRRVTSEEFAGG